jgi:hypothetical protein
MVHLPPHQNHGLFSDHFLNATLPARPEWQHLIESTDVRDALGAIQAIVARYTPSTNEAQTEDDLIKPVLRALGHTFEVQASLEAPGTARKPDYVFYNDEAAQRATEGRKLTEHLLAGRAYAVGDAKYWDRKLDVSLKGQEDMAGGSIP